MLSAFLDRKKKRRTAYISQAEEEISEVVEEFVLEDEDMKFEDAEKTSVVLYSGEEADSEES